MKKKLAGVAVDATDAILRNTTYMLYGTPFVFAPHPIRGITKKHDNAHKFTPRPDNYKLARLP